METKQLCFCFFFADAVSGINSVLEVCRDRFEHVFGTKHTDERNSQSKVRDFGKHPYKILQGLIDNFMIWEELVAEGNSTNLDKLSLYDFIAKLDRIIAVNKKIQQQNKKR